MYLEKIQSNLKVKTKIKLIRMTNIPVDTRHRFNVYKTSIQRRRRRIDVSYRRWNDVVYLLGCMKTTSRNMLVIEYCHSCRELKETMFSDSSQLIGRTVFAKYIDWKSLYSLHLLAVVIVVFINNINLAVSMVFFVSPLHDEWYL